MRFFPIFDRGIIKNIGCPSMTPSKILKRKNKYIFILNFIYNCIILCILSVWFIVKRYYYIILLASFVTLRQIIILNSKASRGVRFTRVEYICTIHLLSNNGRAELKQKPTKYIVDKVNHTYWIKMFLKMQSRSLDLTGNDYITLSKLKVAGLLLLLLLMILLFYMSHCPNKRE